MNDEIRKQQRNAEPQEEAVRAEEPGAFAVVRADRQIGGEEEEKDP
jgi:hypothetical protein